MTNCETCWHLTRLHDEDGCHADRLGWDGGREEYCSCTANCDKRREDA